MAMRRFGVLCSAAVLATSVAVPGSAARADTGWTATARAVSDGLVVSWAAPPQRDLVDRIVVWDGDHYGGRWGCGAVTEFCGTDVDPRSESLRVPTEAAPQVKVRVYVHYRPDDVARLPQWAQNEIADHDSESAYLQRDLTSSAGVRTVNAPRDLVATSLTSERARLQWRRPVPTAVRVTGYRVTRIWTSIDDGSESQRRVLRTTKPWRRSLVVDVAEGLPSTGDGTGWQLTFQVDSLGPTGDGGWYGRATVALGVPR